MAIGESAKSVLGTSPTLLGERMVIALEGAVDLESTSRLDSLFAVAANEDTRYVTLDMSELQLIDVAAISSVLRGIDTLRSAGAELEVRYPSPMAQQLFEMSSMSQVVGIEFTPDAQGLLGSRTPEFWPELGAPGLTRPPAPEAA